MAFGFQFEGTQSASSPFGGFSSDGFGDQPFGGANFTVFPMPTPQIGSDDPEKDVRRRTGEVVLERYGIPIGVRVWTEKRRWNIVYKHKPETFILATRFYWQARRFQLVPDITDETTYYTVLWRGEFDPKLHRGSAGHYDLTIPLEEIT